MSISSSVFIPLYIVFSISFNAFCLIRLIVNFVKKKLDKGGRVVYTLGIFSLSFLGFFLFSKTHFLMGWVGGNKKA
jgi:hypothetical protein